MTVCPDGGENIPIALLDEGTTSAAIPNFFKQGGEVTN